MGCAGVLGEVCVEESEGASGTGRVGRALYGRGGGIVLMGMSFAFKLGKELEAVEWDVVGTTLVVGLDEVLEA